MSALLVSFPAKSRMYDQGTSIIHDVNLMDGSCELLWKRDETGPLFGFRLKYGLVIESGWDDL